MGEASLGRVTEAPQNEKCKYSISGEGIVFIQYTFPVRYDLIFVLLYFFKIYPVVFNSLIFNYSIYVYDPLWYTG